MMLASVRRRLLPLPLPLRAAAAAALSSSSQTTLPKPSSDAATVSYLISSCGLSPTAAVRAARTARFPSAAHADTVLALLRRYDFSDSDISNTIRKFPILLASDPIRTLQPKLDFLCAVGFSGPLLPKIISLSPILLHRSVQDHLIPLFDSLRAILGSDACVVAALRHMPFVIRCDHKATLQHALPALQAHGLSPRDITRLVALQPGVIMQGPDRIDEVVSAVKAAGVSPGDAMFVHVFAIFCKMKMPTLERKIALYQSLGFDKDDVLLMLRRYPSSVAISEEKIKVIVGFLLGTAGLSRDDIVMYPTLLVRSLDSHSRRCAVLSLLKREGRVKEVMRLPVALVISKKRFLEVYVKRHAHHVPDIVRAYNGKIVFKGFGGSEKAQDGVQGLSGKMSV